MVLDEAEAILRAMYRRPFLDRILLALLVAGLIALFIFVCSFVPAT